MEPNVVMEETIMTIAPIPFLVVSIILAFFAAKIPYSFFEKKKKWLFGIACLVPLVLAPLTAWIVSSDFYCQQSEDVKWTYVILVDRLMAVMIVIIRLFTLSIVVVFAKGLINLFRKKPVKWYFVWSITTLILLVAVWSCVSLIAPTMSQCFSLVIPSG